MTNMSVILRNGNPKAVGITLHWDKKPNKNIYKRTIPRDTIIRVGYNGKASMKLGRSL
jgi:hypothetical protein